MSYLRFSMLHMQQALGTEVPTHGNRFRRQGVAHDRGHVADVPAAG